MQNPAVPRSIFIGKLVSSFVLCAAVLFFVWWTIHWRWMWDDSIMHYGNFLMDHGMVLYRDIIDMNMPGSYFIEGWAMHVFGTGDLASRIYEFFLLGTLIASMIVIAWPYEWFAGLFAGVLFLLMHASEGPINSVQREEVMTVLCMAAYAFIFTALRRQWPLLMVAFGFLAGLATSLKPTAAPLGFVLLLMAVMELRRQNKLSGAYIGFGLAGLFASFLVVLDFFIRTHSWVAFLDIMRRLLPYYSGLKQTTLHQMIVNLSMRGMLVLLPIALVLTLAHRNWKNWERWALAVGVCFGAFSYFAQHKGFMYHRYPFVAFILLWAALEFAWGARQTGWVRVLGLAGFVLGTLYVVPLYAYRLHEAPSTTELPDALEHDLVRLGGDKLQHQVQCIDMVSGCVTALYRLNLVQNTGFLGDFLIFQSRGYAPSTYYRDLFWKDLHEHTPQVIVITNAWFWEPRTFDKINQWPEFVQFLDSHYTLLLTREFDDDSEVMGEISYRIYVLKGSGLLAAPE